jgi:hypothetical protein
VGAHHTHLDPVHGEQGKGGVLCLRRVPPEQEATEIDQEEVKNRKRKKQKYSPPQAHRWSLSECIWNQYHTCSGIIYNHVEHEAVSTVGWTTTLIQRTQQI